MTRTPITESSSLLSVDVGSVNTRAVLFDMVEGRYRFLAGGSAPTTAGAPMFDSSEGVRYALDSLQRISGRALVTGDEQLIIPSAEDGSGADGLAPTLSAGEPLKVVAVGLLEKVSLTSVLNLVSSTYARVVETISLNDRRGTETQIDTILRTQPDVVIIAGGTDGGASRSLLKLINSLGMALELLPQMNRPAVLFAGNQELAENVSAYIQQLTQVHIAPNIRPSLETESLGPAEITLVDVFRQHHARRVLGINELNVWSGGHLLPTAAAMGRVARFYSKILDPSKGVLAVDIGASSTVVAAAFAGDLRLRVFPGLGMGEGLSGVLAQSKLEEVTRWLPLDIPDGYVLDYIYNKTLHPASLPATREDMAIEQALAREVMRKAVERAQLSFPKNANRVHPETLPAFEPIIVGGGVLTNAPSLSQSLLMVLDALEPSGLTQILLDKNNLAPALGVGAAVNPTLTAQVLVDPSAFINLGWVVAPVTKARQGSPVLRIRIAYDSGHENVVDVRQGSLQLIPLPAGRTATLYIDPLQRSIIGLGGPGRGTSRRVSGGPFGIVVDARGRPLRLPASPERRREQLQRWHFALGR